MFVVCACLPSAPPGYFAHYMQGAIGAVPSELESMDRAPRSVTLESQSALNTAILVWAQLRKACAGTLLLAARKLESAPGSSAPKRGRGRTTFLLLAYVFHLRREESLPSCYLHRSDSSYCNADLACERAIIL